MKTYNCFEPPLKVFGIPFFEERRTLERLPDDVRTAVPTLSFLGRRGYGGRVGFRTDAERFTVCVTLDSLTPDVGMSIYSCQSLAVMIGDRPTSYFAGIVNPPDYQTKTFEKTFEKDSSMQEITLWLPRNEPTVSVEVTVPDDAAVLPPTPYRYGPALIYGPSIAEGGCCSDVVNGYGSLLSRWLDLDFYNLGFSGHARGEIELADFINTIDFNLFIYDYDYNASTPEHLEKTHEPFFRRIRQKHPDVPVLMLSCPDFDGTDDKKRRREIIEKTYQNAVDAGDNNVRILCGNTFFSEKDRPLCTIDTIHPNDLGFYRMAQAILPTVKELLGIQD